MSSIRLHGVIVTLLLLELACSGHLVESKTRFNHAHHYRQSWSRPSRNWWNWSWDRTPSSDPWPATPQSPSPPTSSPAPAATTLPGNQVVQSPPSSTSSVLKPVVTTSTLAPSPTATTLPGNQVVQSPPPSTSSVLKPVVTTSTLAPSPTATTLPVNQAPQSTSPSTSSVLNPVVTSSTLAPAPTGTILPAVANKTSAGCSNPRVRPEWRTLSRQQQASYITAVKCLANKPSKLLPGGDYRRYDDFENVHSRMRTKIHWMSLFLPWHRHFMFLYEQALRNECGYTGNLPRWDWTLDSKDMTQSPIWSADPMVGFGSNGRNFTDVDPSLDGGVVTDGAFANWDLYYPEYHQLQRNYNLPSQYKVAGRSWGSQYFDQASISKIQSQSTYAQFAVALEGTDPASTGPSNPGPHSIIHVMVGGDISPTSYAANEPLFYLHHSNVDYHWWRWQNAQRSARLNAYGGPTTRGSTKDTARLTDSLKFLSLSADVQVQDTMDTYSSQYCYTY